jgi:hypothetical protein
VQIAERQAIIQRPAFSRGWAMRQRRRGSPALPKELGPLSLGEQQLAQFLERAVLSRHRSGFSEIMAPVVGSALNSIFWPFLVPSSQ